MDSSVLLEACVDSVESALAAEQGGAQRVELCADLLEGGITPSAGMIATVRRALSVDVNVIVRPRGGDFCYSAAEYEVMQHDIKTAKHLGANGIVLALLLEDGSVDVARTAALVAQARPLSVTFHRAFDMARDPFAALETLIDMGFQRVLTSGQEDSALEGLGMLARLVRHADGRIIVMPGGGISERNVARIVAGCGAREVHASLRHAVESMMNYRFTDVTMGGALRPPEFSLAVTDPARVRAVLAALQSVHVLTHPPPTDPSNPPNVRHHPDASANLQ